jgi:UDP-N-acetylmuramoylalanine--D-glutamate ligase
MISMEIEGRKTLVLGAGKSGVASARFLAERGATVALHDKRPIEEWTDAARSLKGSHNVGLLSGRDPFVAARSDRPGRDLTRRADQYGPRPIRG